MQHPTGSTDNTVKVLHAASKGSHLNNTEKFYICNIRVATYRIPVRKYSLKIQTPAHFP